MALDDDFVVDCKKPDKDALTNLSFEATYCENTSHFPKFEEIIKTVINLIEMEQGKKIYLYDEEGTLVHLIAQIGLKLKEKVYVCEDTLEIMRMLCHEEANFTCNPYKARIYVNKAFLKKKGYEDETIIIRFKQCPAKQEKICPIMTKRNEFCIQFNCGSNNKEISKFTNALKQESIVDLYNVIDQSKVTFDNEFKNDIPKEQVNIMDKAHFPSIRSIGYIDSVKIPVSNTLAHDQQSHLTNPSSAHKHKDLNNGNRCPLRIREVQEINYCGSSAVSSQPDTFCGISTEKNKFDGTETILEINNVEELGGNNLLSETAAGSAVNSNNKEITQRTSFVNSLNECCQENRTMEENNKKILNTALCPIDKENKSFIRKKGPDIVGNDGNSHYNTEGTSKETGSKRKLSLINEEITMYRKKLRSNSFMTNLQEPESVRKEEQQTKPCSVTMDRNDIQRECFYSSYHKCFLPKFYDFKIRTKTAATPVTIAVLRKTN